MTYAFMKYWVEGTKEATHQLCEAIENADGWAENALNNLGIDTEEYETGRVEWHDAKVEDKDGYSVLYFEEDHPYERGTLIDQLMEEEMFEDKLTALYYYAEEGACADLSETNDAEGKYWPNRLMVYMEPLMMFGFTLRMRQMLFSSCMISAISPQNWTLWKPSSNMLMIK